jgi:CheY-like chemotaxis protein
MFLISDSCVRSVNPRRNTAYTWPSRFTQIELLLQKWLTQLHAHACMLSCMQCRSWIFRPSIHRHKIKLHSRQENSLYVCVYACMCMQMPLMDGLTSTKHIREWEQSPAGKDRYPYFICAVTAHFSQADRNDCMSAGMNRCAYVYRTDCMSAGMNTCAYVSYVYRNDCMSAGMNRCVIFVLCI